MKVIFTFEHLFLCCHIGLLSIQNAAVARHRSSSGAAKIIIVIHLLNLFVFLEYYFNPPEWGKTMRLWK